MLWERHLFPRALVLLTSASVPLYKGNAGSGNEIAGNKVGYTPALHRRRFVNPYVGKTVLVFLQR